MTLKELQAKATKLREAADVATQKAKEAAKKKAANAKKLKEAAEKAEAEAKQAEEKAKEAEEDADGEDDDDDDETDQDGDHDDADQDKALIKKMIAQYIGKGTDGMSDDQKTEMESLAKEAYEGHKEMGKNEKEAYQHAGEALKLAHHMACKQAKESEDGDGNPPPKKKKPAAASGDNDGGDTGGAADDDGEDDDSSESDSQESNREKKLSKKLLEAEGRIAALENTAKKVELNKYVERALKKSGQPNSVTKRFREAAGPFKSKTDFDSKWSIFQEGLKETRNDDLDFSVFQEKGGASDDGGRGDGETGLDFSECAE